MSTALEWTKGYARQAAADFDAWNFLQGTNSIPECHKLQFLQMACEKLTKAHLCKAGSDPKDLQASHNYIAKILHIVIRQEIAQLGRRFTRARWVIQYTKQLAQEIEVLSPAADRDGRRPDNCEYPWEDNAGQMHSPLEWTFAPSKLLTAPAGRTFLKLVRHAISRFL